MNERTPIRVLVVDDEPLARKKIANILREDKRIQFIDEASNGLEAIQFILERNPDVVFLDIQMPQMDGFGVIETIGAEQMPSTVFVTAFDEYAVQAFEAQAIDYLLKPFKAKRFQETLERAIESIDRKNVHELNQRLIQLLADVGKKHQYLERIVIKNNRQIVLLSVGDIDWIDSAGNYVEIHANGKAHLLRETMNRLESQLEPSKFLRIHRSKIVNLDKVKSIQTDVGRDCIVVMQNGTQLPMSRRYREKLNQFH